MNSNKLIHTKDRIDNLEILLDITSNHNLLYNYIVEEYTPNIKHYMDECKDEGLYFNNMIEKLKIKHPLV